MCNNLIIFSWIQREFPWEYCILNSGNTDTKFHLSFSAWLNKLWWLGTNVPPKSVWGVWVCSHWQTLSWTSKGVRSSKPGQGYQAGKGSVLVFEGFHKWQVAVGRAWLLHVCWWASSWTSWWGGNLWTLVSAFCVYMCVWEMCSTSVLIEPAKGKAAGASFSLGRDPSSPSTELGSSSQAGRIPPAAVGSSCF